MNLIFDCINKELTERVERNKHAIIRILSNFYNIKEPTYQDLKNFRNYIHDLIWNDNLSAKEVQIRLDVKYSDFGIFIKKCLGIKLKNHKEANILSAKKLGKNISDEKMQYRKECAFKFDPYSYPDIPNYNLLLLYGLYNSKTNTTGVTRDHIISVDYGWRHKIDPTLISSIYNCRFLFHLENLKKNTRSDLTVEELLEKINTNNFTYVEKAHIHLSKTDNHKKKLSEANKGYFMITNEIENKRIHFTQEIPEGFRRGFIRNK